MPAVPSLPLPLAATARPGACPNAGGASLEQVRTGDWPENRECHTVGLRKKPDEFPEYGKEPLRSVVHTDCGEKRQVVMKICNGETYEQYMVITPA